MRFVLVTPALAVIAAVPPLATPAAAQPGSSAISCTRLNVNATKPGDALTVSVNGATVGSYSGDAGVYQDLEQRMRPGVNRVTLTFAAPYEKGPFGTSAELRCLPPGSTSSRDTILQIQPTAKKLSAEIDVNLVAR